MITDDIITAERPRLVALLAAARDVLADIVSPGACIVCGGTESAHVEECAAARLAAAVEDVTR